jgi:hypothetical protein
MPFHGRLDLERVCPHDNFTEISDEYLAKILMGSDT